MARRLAGSSPTPGVFRPAVPEDSQEVIRLYAIAARTVCERPDTAERVGQTLVEVTRDLIAPESEAAAACQQLWKLFTRYAASPKVSLRHEAARAVYRDLETLAQRMDVPPLPAWERIPLGVDAPNALVREVRAAAPDDALALLRRRAQAALARSDADPPRLEAADVVALLGELTTEDQSAALAALVREDGIDRGEGQMLVRWLRHPQPLGPDDEALRETLERVGHVLHD